MDLLFAGLGLVILLLAGDALVKGAVNLSLRVGVPALIVSLTIVAFGTSAPELLISVKAIMDQAPGIAIGNVVGSNTANILLVLGIPAMISGLHTSECETRKTYVFMLIATVLFIALAFFGPLTWVHGLILLAGLAIMLGDQMIEAMAHRKEHNNNNAAAAVAEQIEELEAIEEIEGADPSMPGWKIVTFLILGLIGLPLGADLLVDSAVSIATRLGISEEVIGLTLIAIGTSLPELATTVMAALRRQADVALGNVIGSNMFNLLAIIGVAALVGDIPVAEQFLRVDLWVMLGASLLLFPFVYLRWNITKLLGVALTGVYCAYLVSVVA